MQKKVDTDDAPVKTESLRDKGRRETREALIKAAEELMSVNGFLNVTMQEVADRAGTHVQPLYAHFPNKYALGSAASVESFRIAIAERNTDTITFWRDWVEQQAHVALAADTGTQVRQFVADQKSETRLAPLTKAISFDYTDLLTRHVATDFGLDPKLDLRPKLVAHMLWAAHEHAMLEWQEADDGHDLVAGVHRAIDQVANIVNLVRAAQDVAGN